MPYTEHHIGWKGRAPSRQAAEGMASRSETIRTLILDHMALNNRPQSADDIATAIGIDFMSVRPRISELAQDGQLSDSGVMKTSRSGKPATGWIATFHPRKDEE